MIPADSEAYFLNEWIQSFINGEEISDVQMLRHEDSFYECRVKKLNSSKNTIGYIVELQDCTDRKRYFDLLENYNTDLERQVKEQTNQIRVIQRKIVLRMADMVENRDDSTGGHIKRTSDVIETLVGTIKKNHLFNISEEFCQVIIRAAPMHDLGKIAIQDKNLQKFV